MRVEEHGLATGDDLRGVRWRCCEAQVRHPDASFARVWSVDPTGLVLKIRGDTCLNTRTDSSDGRFGVGIFKIGLIAEGK